MEKEKTTSSTYSDIQMNRINCKQILLNMFHIKMCFTSIMSTHSLILRKLFSQVTSYSSSTPSARRKYDLAILRNLGRKMTQTCILLSCRKLCMGFYGRFSIYNCECTSPGPLCPTAATKQVLRPQRASSCGNPRLKT